MNKNKILKEVLKLVPFEGWTDKTLQNASQNVNLHKYAYIDFPNGIDDVTDYFIEKNDEEMEKRLAKLGMDKLKIRERIAKAILIRIDLYKENREAVRQMVAYFALPSNAGRAVINVSETVSKMWYTAGDTSSDFNYYTKRFLLAGVYTSTLLYWLNDESKEYKDTEEFLYRRIEDVMKIQKVKGKAEENIEKIKNIILSYPK